MAEMCVELAQGVQHLSGAFAALGHDADAANAEAAAAIKLQRNLEHTYRAAMSSSSTKDDLHEVAGRQELYRRITHVSDAIVAVADRVMYSTVKEG